MKNVFIQFEHGKVDVLRVAMRSWSRRGWTVKINLIPDPSRGLNVLSRDINYSFKRGKMRRVRFGKRGWKTAAVVRFPEFVTEDQILNARPL